MPTQHLSGGNHGCQHGLGQAVEASAWLESVQGPASCSGRWGEALLQGAPEAVTALIPAARLYGILQVSVW